MCVSTARRRVNATGSRGTVGGGDPRRTLRRADRSERDRSGIGTVPRPSGPTEHERRTPPRALEVSQVRSVSVLALRRRRGRIGLRQEASHGVRRPIPRETPAPSP